MTRILSPARLLPAAGCALLCLMLALGYARAQTTPAAPTIDSVTPGDTQLKVAWTAPAGETGISAYDVRHIETSEDETDDSKWTVVDDAWTSGTLEYTISMLTNGTQYDVQVRAVNSNGDGAWSGTEVGTPALPAPTISSVRPDDRAMFVSWSAPSGITTGIKAYDVRYIATSSDETVDSNWTVEEDAWEDGGGSLTYAVTGLTNDTEYKVQVRAVDEDDVDGVWSATTSATPEDHGDTRADATRITVDARIWGAIDPTDDEDYFSFTVSDTADYWIYTLGDLDTVGELLDSNGMLLESDDYGAVLPNPDGFFLWRKLDSGTYYIKVTGYGSTEEPYVLRVRAFPERTGWPTAPTLSINGSASGTIDPEDDTDFFRLTISTTTEVAIRASGFPDTVGELYNSRSTLVEYNDDGYLPGGSKNFLIRTSLDAGTYYLNVSSFDERSDGPFTVYLTAITEPSSTIADAQALTLRDAAGGIIDPAGDEDYFSLTLDETTHVIIGGVSRATDISGELLDSNNMRAPLDSIHFDDRFIFQGTLDSGTYYLKVTGKEGTDTGRYTVRAIVEGGYTYFVNRCSNISRISGINDPLYGCQWHLNNDDQFRNSAGHDIRVEEVWPTYTGNGINVAVVDDGMHFNHEDLTDNVDSSLNHNYDPDLTDIYHYFERHGTAVAGLIAAKDNSLGVRGVAPGATIYGYNYLVEQSDANEADAMSRNATTTAISNNSWGSRDYGTPEYATDLWQRAVENSVTTGYDGKGVVYVWSAGNGGEDNDYSNLDELNNHYAVIAACAVGHDDKRSSYSESGSNLWVCAPSSSGRVGQPRIATTDNGNRYWGRFGGTSAAAPIVSGVVALVREANSALTWRDVKIILAASARKNDPDNTGWEQGALKYGSATDHYNFNHEYGFGMVDAKAAVDLATGWTNAPELREVTSETAVINLAIPDAPSSGTPTTVSTSLTVEPYVEFIEFVEINTHFNHPYFRDLIVELVSPSGAVSVLTTSAPVEGALTSEFRMGSARHLGENAEGEWTLRIKDAQGGDSGLLKSWGLTIYGHGYIPGAPDIDTVTPGGGTLEIEWDAPTDTGATAITSYDLRYIPDDVTDRSDDKWSLETGVGTPTNRSHTITGLEGGKKYEFQIRAHNDSGHGPWSKAEADEPTTVAPSAPSITNITRGDRTLAVVWTAPSDTGGGNITAYDVHYIETSADETVEGNWTVQDNAWRSGDLRYVISNLTNATEYDVQVRAVNSAGDGEWSDTETGTPLPDDIPITLQWEETSIELAEDAGSAVLRTVFTTTLNAPPAADFTFDVTLTTTDVSATQDDDYTPPASSATFVAGDFSQTDVNGQQRYRATRDFSVAILDDTEDESDEDFRVTLAYQTPGLSHLQGGPSTAVITIRDNDHVPVSIGWERRDVTVSENARTVTLRATATTTKDKMPDAGFTFDVSIFTSDGSATQPDDYTQLAKTVTFDRSDFGRATVDGQRTYRAVKQVEVTVVDDTDDEPDEDFGVNIAYSNPGLPHLLGGPADASVTITDNDHVPVTMAWEQTALTVDEDVGSVTLSAVAVTTKDKMPESGFSFDASIDTSDGSATESEDYRRLNTTARFNQRDFSLETVNGQQRYQAVKELTLRITDDTEDEDNEDLDVTLAYSNAAPHLQGGADTATITITDNDHVPVVLGWEQTALTADEVTGSITLTAVAITTKDKMPEIGFSFDFTVNTSDGSARQPGDYTALSQTATFGESDFSFQNVNGQSRYRAEREFIVSITNDATVEQPERFTVGLGYSDRQPHLIQGDLTATVTIVDDISSTVDLGVTVFGSSSRASRGDELTYSFTVTNRSPATSTNTVLTTTLDRGVSFASTTPADRCSRSGRRVDCRFGTMSAGDTQTGEIVVLVEPAAAADIIIASEARSNEIDINPADNTATEVTELVAPPEGVTNLRATGGGTHIALSWTRPADNGSPITAYELERKEDGGSYVPVSPAPTVSATTYQDSQVTAGMTYTYQLRAINVDGDAEWSNEASSTTEVTRPPPPPPPPRRTGGGGGGGGGTRVNQKPEIDGRDSVTFKENGSGPVATYSADDPEGDEVSWDIDGLDSDAFEIDQEGVLTFKEPPDYESPTDFDRDNAYQLRLLATDDGSPRQADALNVRVRVTKLNELGPVTGESEISVPENLTGQIAIYQAEDPEDNAVVWSLSGPDASGFEIDQQGSLTLTGPLDFETPASSVETNLHLITVTATDDGRPPISSELQVAVTVSNVNEAPVAIATSTVDLTAGDDAAKLDLDEMFTDPDGDTLTYELSGRVDPDVLSVSVASSTVLITPVGSGAAAFEVVATDPGGLTATTTIDVLVAKSPDAPSSPVCSWVGNILSWTAAKNSEGGASSSLFLWLEGVLRAWSDLACK